MTFNFWFFFTIQYYGISKHFAQNRISSTTIYIDAYYKYRTNIFMRPGFQPIQQWHGPASGKRSYRERKIENKKNCLLSTQNAGRFRHALRFIIARVRAICMKKKSLKKYPTLSRPLRPAACRRVYTGTFTRISRGIEPESCVRPRLFTLKHSQK